MLGPGVTVITVVFAVIFKFIAFTPLPSHMAGPLVLSVLRV